MRISDWSSDVCSSDLMDPVAVQQRHPLIEMRVDHLAFGQLDQQRAQHHALATVVIGDRIEQRPQLRFESAVAWRIGWRHMPEVVVRSEEHTSELQSLMRISYAVFCL